MSRKSKVVVLVILLLAAVLRLWGLGRGDTVNDEVFYAFRAIGPLDFDHAEFQTTPLEWFDPKIPNWTKLSFHDHPPLVFWAQHFFIKIFGENNFAFRLPSALLGIASVLLIFWLGRQLYPVRNNTPPLCGADYRSGQFPRGFKYPARISNGIYWRQVGLLAAAIFAVTLNQVYISRTGLQEAYVIFFILLASLLFLKALERDTHFLWLGVVLGLAFLTKYTAFIMLPIFLVYILWFRRDLLFNKKLWIGIALTFLVFSPVIIYNLQLYRAVGHFDFQFSYIFGQNPEVWQTAPGKEIGTLQDRLAEFMPRLIATHSWLFLLLLGASFVFFLWGVLREPKEIFHTHRFLLIASVFMGFWIIFFIGPSFRFLTMLTPFLVFPVALLLDTLYNYKFTASGFIPLEIIPRRSATRVTVSGNSRGDLNTPREFLTGFILRKPRLLTRSFFFFGLFLFFFFEVAYSYNSQITYYPRGNYPWFFSKIRYENYNWGYNDLNNFLQKELAGKMPARVFDMQYEFLEKIRDANLLKAKEAGFKPYPALLVYYGNFDDGAKLWVLERLMTYHGWPVIKVEDYFGFLEKNGPAYFAKSGLQEYYFIIMNNIEPSPAVRALLKNLPFSSIFNKKGEEVFRVYRNTSQVAK